MTSLFSPGMPADSLAAKFDDWWDSRIGLLGDLSLSKHNLLGPTWYTATVRTRLGRGLWEVRGQGASRCRTLAMNGAVGEALERGLVSTPRREEGLVGEFWELSASRILLNPMEFPRRAEAQAPLATLEPTTRLGWTAMTDARNKQEVFIPSQYVFLPHLPITGEEMSELSTSCGLAAGPSPEHATLNALMELIERDAFALTWLGMRPTPRIPLDSCASLAGFHWALRDRLIVRDLTTEWGVPVAMALFFGDGVQLPRLAVGAGAALTMARAVEKAVDEVAGCLYFGKVLLDRGAKLPDEQDPLPSFDDHAKWFVKHCPPEVERWLRESNGEPRGHVSLADGAELQSHLLSWGVRIFLRDLSHPELERRGVTVIRAVSPDLQPLWVGRSGAHLLSPRLEQARARGVVGDHLNLVPHPFP